MVQCLIDNGADPSIKDDNGWTALHCACSGLDVEVVKFLLSQGSVNVNEKTNDGRTPLQIASAHDQPEVVWFLVSQYPGLVLEGMVD